MHVDLRLALRLALRTHRAGQSLGMGQFMQKAHEWGERLPTGVLLENRTVPTFAQRIARRNASYETAPPAQRPIADEAGRPVADLTAFYQEMKVT